MAFAVLGLQFRQCSILPDARDTHGCGGGQERRHNRETTHHCMTVALAGGPIEGAPLCLAAGIAHVVNEDTLHIIPIVTRGAAMSTRCYIFHLRCVDAANGNSVVRIGIHQRGHYQSFLRNGSQHVTRLPWSIRQYRFFCCDGYRGQPIPCGRPRWRVCPAAAVCAREPQSQPHPDTERRARRKPKNQNDRGSGRD
jgi:hypothetical protein